MNLRDTITRRAATGGIAAVLLAIASDGAGANEEARKRKQHRRNYRRQENWWYSPKRLCCPDGTRVVDGTCPAGPDGAAVAPMHCRAVCASYHDGVRPGGCALSRSPDCVPGCDEWSVFNPDTRQCHDTDGAYNGYTICWPEKRERR